MKFGRYTTFVRDVYAIFGVIFLIELYVFGDYAIKQKQYLMSSLYILLYLFCMIVLYLMLHWVPCSEGGHMSDYIVFAENRVELHSKESKIYINWSEIVEIRQIIPTRGVRKVKIIARDGTIISFTSDGGREKKILKIHPELKSKLKTSRM